LRCSCEQKKKIYTRYTTANLKSGVIWNRYIHKDDSSHPTVILGGREWYVDSVLFVDRALEEVQAELDWPGEAPEETRVGGEYVFALEGHDNPDGRDRERKSDREVVWECALGVGHKSCDVHAEDSSDERRRQEDHGEVCNLLHRCAVLDCCFSHLSHARTVINIDATEYQVHDVLEPLILHPTTHLQPVYLAQQSFALPVHQVSAIFTVLFGNQVHSRAVRFLDKGHGFLEVFQEG